MILHNSIRVAQNLSRRNSHAQIKLGDMPSLNNCVRLTYGHRDKGEQYSGSPEHQHCLGSEVPTKNVESCEDNQSSLRREAQRLCGSLRPAQNLQVTKSHSQNNPEIIGKVNYKAFVVQNSTYEIFVGHSITGSNPVQPFGSIPCRRNSARANSFNQLPRLTPSRSAASLSCWRNSGVIRIWKVGDSPSPFGVLSRLIVDMYVRNPLAWILLCTYVNTANIQKTTPRTVGAVPGRLTTNR